jgi:hypothetical protein
VNFSHSFEIGFNLCLKFLPVSNSTVIGDGFFKNGLIFHDGGFKILFKNTLDGWAQRAEKIHNDATPAVENAKMKIAVAWHEKEKANEKAWFELVHELEILE